jgi:DNA-directed RNA polymerase subunit RPC12/RpoP
MLPHTRCPTRDGCIVGARLVTWEQIEQHYVCRECGGRPVHHIVRVNDQTVDYAECADCGNRDFTSSAFYQRQLADAPTIFFGLPPELKALFPQSEPLDITVDEAIADLYGQGD